ncbi:MAG: SMP-30/gluconolactonase/LRE family protein [Streptosporangiaceae bacterium]
MKAEQLTEPAAYHGEGPLWHELAGVLRWVDMLAGDILTLTPAGSIDRLHIGTVAAAMRPRAAGGLVAAVEHGFVLIDGDGQIGPERTAFTDPACRMNEGGVDRQGRFFSGSMAYDGTSPRGALYRFAPGGEISVVFTGVAISNGIAWTADGEKVFYIDTPTQRIDVFDYDPATGLPSGRRPVVHVDPDQGAPDGMALDAEGGIWVALYGGHAVHRYREDGTLDAVIDLPVSQVTSCTFGGPDLDQLFITTSREKLPPGAEPQAGAIFRATPGVRGLPLGSFAG